jgi:hypothetical protein
MKFGTMIQRNSESGATTAFVMAIASPMSGAVQVDESYTITPGKWIGFTLADPNGMTDTVYYPLFGTCLLETGPKSLVIKPTIP